MVLNLLTATQNMEKTIQKIPDGNPKRQDSQPVLLEKRKPFIAMRKAFVFDQLSKENIAPDGAQSEGDRVKNQPKDDLFCFYLGPVFLFSELSEGLTSHKVPDMFRTKSIFPQIAASCINRRPFAPDRIEKNKCLSSAICAAHSHFKAFAHLEQA